MSTPLFEGRVAIVTGGARGLGLAVANTLHAQGASVVIADSGASIDGRETDAALADTIARSLGGRVMAFAEDISVPGAAETLINAARERFGAIDIVINNAAILRDALIFKSNREDWEHVLRVNLHTPFAVLAAATPHMRDQVKAGRAPGRIVNVISSAGLIGNFGQSAYAAAKAGLVGLTRVVAMEMARSEITCNAVAPFASTRVTEAIQPANEAQAEYKSRALRVPAGYVARLIGYLCCGANVATGQIFGVRGREVFLYSQSRPQARVVGDTLAKQDILALGGAMEAAFAGQFTDLATDLEVFNTEPMV